ncbi:MAG: biotin-dependent carboxyltransferase family protein [Pseudomonadota bacterium]
MSLIVRSIGPTAAFQDAGRPGHFASGLTRGGAIDTDALAEGAALLGNSSDCAAVEMAGMGGTFEATAPLRIALTGADMTARIGDSAATWHACHAMKAGDVLTIGAARKGTYGYLHVGGGFDAPQFMGTRGAHMSAGLGRLIEVGDTLAARPDPGNRTGLRLPTPDRFDGGTVRIVPSVQTAQFPQDVRQRFEATTFTRDPRANRQGMRMEHEGEGFSAEAQRKIVSEIIVPGDIQITGDGTPFVLMCESQTTGGYPRIGTVIPCDLSRVAQCPIGGALRFRFVTLAEAQEAERRARAWRTALPSKATPILRDPAEISDLLSYNFISGAISAHNEVP